MRKLRVLAFPLILLLCLSGIYASASGQTFRQWYLYYMAGVPSGKSYVEYQESGDKEIITTLSTLRVNVYGQVKLMKIRSLLEKMGNTFKMEASMSADVPMRVRAWRKGKRIKVEYNGEVRVYEIPEGTNLYTSYDLDGALRTMARKGIREKEVMIFDPFVGKPVKAYLKFVGKARETIEGHTCEGRKYVLGMMGATSTLYYNPERGITVCEIDTSGMVSVAVEGEPHVEGKELPDLIERFSVQYHGPDPSKYTVMLYRLDGVSLSGLNLTGFRQRWQDGWLKVSIEDLPRASYKPPYRGRKYLHYLGKSDLINPELKELKSVLRNLNLQGKTAIEVFRAVIYWVYNNIKKEPVISIPSPEEILKTKKGDCNEHAVLSVALLRAAGIPSRVAVGLLYMNGRFYYHAWVEAFVGSWISGDPVVGQIPADVSHIRFAAGDLENWLAIYRFLGRIKITGRASH